jgi:hypothetical protein
MKKRWLIIFAGIWELVIGIFLLGWVGYFWSPFYQGVREFWDKIFVMFFIVLALPPLATGILSLLKKAWVFTFLLAIVVLGMFAFFSLFFDMTTLLVTTAITLPPVVLIAISGKEFGKPHI